MSNLSEVLSEEMSSNVMFHLFGKSWLPVDEACVVSWIIMAVIALLCFLLTRNLKVTNISRRQALIEWAVVKLESIITGMVGESNKRYVPYLTTVLLYLSLANIAGVFGFKPPTKTLNVTAALALMSIILVQIAGVRARGGLGWLKTYRNPINILDLFTRPLSLCMRLFGNVLGAFVIMMILESVVPVLIPAVFSLYFDFFDGILQAYVFVFLTSMYIKEAAETEE